MFQYIGESVMTTSINEIPNLCRLQIVSYLQRCYNTSIDYDNYYQLTNSIVYKVIYYESRESMNRLKAQQVEIDMGIIRLLTI